MKEPDKRFIRRCSKILKCMEFKGYICTDCKKDLSDTPWDAEFHHLDPKIKDSSISQMMDNHWSTIIEELKKCILLCCGCHRQRHFNVDRYNKYKKIIKRRISEIDLYKDKKIDKDKVYYLIKKGETIIDIALKLNAQERSVRRVLRSIEKIKKEKLIPTREEYLGAHMKITDTELLNCLNNNMKKKEIMKKFNMSSGGLYKRIKKLETNYIIIAPS